MTIITDPIIAYVALGVFALVFISGIIAVLNCLKSRKPEHSTADYKNYIIIAEELNHIFKKRTGLSSELFKLILNEGSNDDYGTQVAIFLDYVVNSLERILTNVTGNKCSISIKIFVPSANDSHIPLVQTSFRDSDSAIRRHEIYDKFEPFSYKDNTLFKELIDNLPKKRFKYSNDLKNLYPHFHSQNPGWEKIQNASAVHLICDPNSDDQDGVFGLLVADNKMGGFDSSLTPAIMSIVSTAIFYCVNASAVIEAAKEQNIPLILEEDI